MFGHACLCAIAIAGHTNPFARSSKRTTTYTAQIVSGSGTELQIELAVIPAVSSVD
jgi:hypothetical protein